ncbi:MAG: EF-hand domain-containing protein [Myxococcales bacterium]|nr:EF-hand domain-containing protein [Myxococcales bacterium]
MNSEGQNKIVAALEKIFADGKVEAEEIDDIWANLDVSGDGAIGPDELKALTGLVEQTALAQDAELDAATLEFIWRGHDATGDGKFSKDELRRALQAFASISASAASAS